MPPFLATLVWAEVATVYGEKQTELEAALEMLALGYSEVTREAALEAARHWHAYRSRGGSRQRIAADFIVGAPCNLVRVVPVGQIVQVLRSGVEDPPLPVPQDGGGLPEEPVNRVPALRVTDRHHHPELAEVDGLVSRNLVSVGVLDLHGRQHEIASRVDERCARVSQGMHVRTYHKVRGA